MTIENCQPSESMDRLPQACTQAALRNASEESWTAMSGERPKAKGGEPSVLEFTPLAYVGPPESTDRQTQVPSSTTDIFGNKTTELGERARIVESADGTTTISAQGDTYTVVGKPKISEDGAVEVELLNHPQDNKQVYQPDGTVDHFKRNGDLVKDYPDGRHLVTSQEGITMQYPDGSWERTKWNGEAIRVDSKGHKEILVEHEEPGKKDVIDRLVDWIHSL